MKFTWFNLMPWPYLPEDFREKHRSVWVDIPNTLYEPRRGHFVYHEYMDQLECADALGFDYLAQAAAAFPATPADYWLRLARETGPDNFLFIPNLAGAEAQRELEAWSASTVTRPLRAPIARQFLRVAGRLERADLVEKISAQGRITDPACLEEAARAVFEGLGHPVDVTLDAERVEPSSLLLAHPQRQPLQHQRRGVDRQQRVAGRRFALLVEMLVERLRQEYHVVLVLSVRQPVRHPSGFFLPTLDIGGDLGVVLDSRRQGRDDQAFRRRAELIDQLFAQILNVHGATLGKVQKSLFALGRTE